MWILCYLKRNDRKKALSPNRHNSYMQPERSQAGMKPFPESYWNSELEVKKAGCQSIFHGMSMGIESGKFQWKKNVTDKSIHRQGNDDRWTFSKSVSLRSHFWKGLPRLWCQCQLGYTPEFASLRKANWSVWGVHFRAFFPQTWMYWANWPCTYVHKDGLKPAEQRVCRFLLNPILLYFQSVPTQF